MILSFLWSPTSTERWGLVLDFHTQIKLKTWHIGLRGRAVRACVWAVGRKLMNEWMCAMSPGLLRWFGWMSQALFLLNYCCHFLFWWNILIFWCKAVNPLIARGEFWIQHYAPEHWFNWIDDLMWSTLQFFSLSFTLNASHLNEHTSFHTVLAAEINRTEIGT